MSIQYISGKVVVESTVVSKEMKRVKKAAEARERKVTKNSKKESPEPKKSPEKKKKKTISYADNKALVAKRIRQNPGTFVSERYGSKLKCVYCNKFVGAKSSNVDDHVVTDTHINGIAAFTIAGNTFVII